MAAPVVALVDGKFAVKVLVQPHSFDRLCAWACRGPGKGCGDGRAMPCEDCLGPVAPEMTYRQIVERLRMGDA